MAMSAGYIPFHPNLSKPKYKPPPGAVDTHCHVFGPDAKFSVISITFQDPSNPRSWAIARVICGEAVSPLQEKSPAW
jgi:2-pyrone-4,6-dicarboxylate lactonase